MFPLFPFFFSFVAMTHCLSLFRYDSFAKQHSSVPNMFVVFFFFLKQNCSSYGIPNLQISKMLSFVIIQVTLSANCNMWTLKSLYRFSCEHSSRHNPFYCMRTLKTPFICFILITTFKLFHFGNISLVWLWFSQNSQNWCTFAL